MTEEARQEVLHKSAAALAVAGYDVVERRGELEVKTHSRGARICASVKLVDMPTGSRALVAIGRLVGLERRFEHRPANPEAIVGLVRSAVSQVRS